MEIKESPFRIYELTRVKHGYDKSFIIEGLPDGYIRTRYSHEHPSNYGSDFNGACALLEVTYRADNDLDAKPLFGLFMVYRKTDYDTGNEMIECEPLVGPDGKQIAFTHEELTESPFAQIWHNVRTASDGYPIITTIFSLPVSLKEKREMEAEEKNNQ